MASQPNYHRLRDRIEEDLSAIMDTDLRLNDGHGPYVVLTSETALRPYGWFGGLHHPQMHKWLQADIGSRWRGNGPAVLVDDSLLPAINATETFLGIVIHEVAHAADTPHLFDHDVIDGKAVQHVRRSVFADYCEGPTPTPWTPSVRAGHELPWIRLCLHLHHRLASCGWEIPIPFVIDRERYAYSPSASYRRALGDELTGLADVPLTELAAIPAPQRFTDLWVSDLAKWPDA